MDAVTLLIADHNRVRGLFTRFKAAHESDDHAAMAEIGAAILEELAVHTEIEEQVFYPEVAGADAELGELVAEGVEEHHVVDILADEIKALPVDDEAWAAKMTVLIENVQHHAEEEEQEMFPMVRTAFDAAALTALGDRLETMKAELGAPTLADKQDLNGEDLRQLARDQEIPGRSSMDQDELRATVAPSS